MTPGEKHKHFISVDGGSNYTSVKLIKAPVLSASREKDIFDFRPKTTEWRLKRNENVTVYDAIVTMLENPSTASVTIRCKTELYENWITLTGIEFEGYVSLGSVKLNLDTGVLEFNPTPTTGYEWWEKNKGVEHDIFKEVPEYSKQVYYDIQTVTEEYHIPFGGNYTDATGFHSADGTASAWNSTTQYIGGWTALSWARTPGKLWHAMSDSLNVDPEDPLQDSWEQIENGIGGYVNITHRIHRQVCDLPFYTGGHEYLHGDGQYEEGFPAVTSLNTEASNCDTHRYYSLVPEAPESGRMTLLSNGFEKGGVIISDGVNHELSDIFTHMLIDSGLTLQSDFFTNAVNPITGENPSPTAGIRMAHNRAIKGIQDGDTKGIITLERLLTDLCTTFNCCWYIDSANNLLILEHILYFENGMDYKGTPSVYTNLTDLATYPLKYQTIYNPDGTEADNEYGFAGADAPEKEKFSFPDGYDYDGQIRYDSSFCKKGEEQEHAVTTFMTDFAWLYYQRVASADDLYCLLSCDEDGVIIRRDANLRWSPGTIYHEKIYEKQETDYPNGAFMWDNLIRDYWLHFCYFLSLHVNGEYTSFVPTYQKRIKKQREINFPRIKTGLYDPFGMITTNMGDGKVDSYSINTDTDFIKVILLYN